MISRLKTEQGRGVLCVALLIALYGACGDAPVDATHPLAPAGDGEIVTKRDSYGLPSHPHVCLPPLFCDVEVRENPVVSPVITRGIPVESCEFEYDFSYDNPNDWIPEFTLRTENGESTSFERRDGAGPDTIAHLEPLAQSTWDLALGSKSLFFDGFALETLTMPDYPDALALFERAGPWEFSTRCYEFPSRSVLLTEEQAYDLYLEMVQKTLWYQVDQTHEVRTVLGFRGAHPGMLVWNENYPNRFNDTLVLLWRDNAGKHVREFPVSLDTGAYDFGYHSSSSLKPNRHYPYTNGWHRNYNALQLQEGNYRVRDDSNKNGYGDSDRNGWYSGGAEDHDRWGFGHNMHVASVDGSLGQAAVGEWSAGCQVVPGMANWVEFLGHAWTQLGDRIDYFLLDTRDIDPRVWNPCDQPLGSHECPHEIREYPFIHRGDTSASSDNRFATYNCSPANEGGPEVVYVVNIRRSGTLLLSVFSEDEENVDPDIHILWGDDSRACLARGHQAVSYDIDPGRYLVVVDTWVNEQGRVLAGEYELVVDFDD